MRHGWIGVLAPAIVQGAALGAGLSYAVTSLGTGIFPGGINNQGQVVGTIEGTDGSGQAFLWQNNTGVVPLQTWVGYPNSVGLSINNQGSVVGYSYNDPPDGIRTYRGFLAQPASGLVDLSGGTGWTVLPSQVNDAGQVVGIGSTGSTFQTQFGVVWLAQNGPVAVSLNSQPVVAVQRINNLGQMAVSIAGGSGISFYAPGSNPIEIKNVSLTAETATGMNDEGSVVGFASPGDSSSPHAYVWNQTTGRVDLTPDGSGIANGINNSGHVVGVGTSADGTRIAFIYGNGTLSDLSTLLDASGVGWSSLYPEAINDSGQITGYGLLDGEQTGFVLTPAASPSGSSSVPEPASAATLGVVGLLLLRRRRA